ncbi:uncharacterized protein LOC123298592 [Chrysoperla carnea]|uniref:uncharacterized protein LOC123298592 n=1 Tax=Chrysoperla carnea TaxID=189513 RepID=UPI001D05C86C|nr:uncharacterized protein LOC123298592 [Chrysoperla carnea]
MRSFNVFALTLTIALALSCVHAAPKPAGFLTSIRKGISDVVHGIGHAVGTAGETVGNVIDAGAKGIVNTAGSLFDNVGTVVKGEGDGNVLHNIGNGVVDVIDTLGNGIQNVSNALGTGMYELLNNEKVQEEAKMQVEKEIDVSSYNINKQEQETIFTAIINELSSGQLKGNELTDSKKATKVIREYLKKNGISISSDDIQNYLDILLKVLSNISIEIVTDESPKKEEQVEYVWYYEK